MAALLSISISACINQSNQAEDFLNDIDIASYRIIDARADESRVGPWAEVIIVGPEIDDSEISSILRSPGLVIRARDSTTLQRVDDEIWIASGSANSCHIAIYRLIDDEQFVTEVSGVGTDSVSAFRIHATCGAG
ncbi:hypothetical protein [Nocardia sp. AG03]|uniref:hypothetical protein n=1 Tax=Nocardia sp. AG03 TaxID=3025312 RepID=UPI002418176C|nr:hypothetical protein [Nocardia sp. AG03]